MVKYKSFSLPGGGQLRIRANSIIATVHSPSNKIDIYCVDKEIPFHVEATKHTPTEIVDYIWDGIEEVEM